MTHPNPTRRDALLAFGGACLASTLGRPTLAAEPPAGVDVHLHLADPRVPGQLDVPVALAPFPKDDTDGPKRLAEMVAGELKAAGITRGLCMPRMEVSDADPLGIRDTLAIIDMVRGPTLHPIGLAHPERYDRDHLDRVAGVLKEGRVRALKAYLGYLHHEPISPGYRPYFALAAKYNVPVIFHCGDTFSRTAKVKFARPLLVDEAAVDFPDTTFVIAHFGNPWLMDAAEVVYKNKNVYADVSAILIGNAAALAAYEKSGTMGRNVKRVREAVEFSEAPERFLFGSDWPLVPVAAYRDFARRCFDEKDWPSVFGGAAEKLFRLKGAER